MAQQATLLTPNDAEASFNVVDSEIENTGAASCNYDNYTLNVMVWDGPTQGFGWEYAAPSLIYPYTENHDFYTDDEVHDADVIIAQKSDSTLMYIVYEKDQSIYSEIWQYTGSSWVNYQTPTLISNSSHECSNPNIDRYDFDHVAIVWETHDGIFGVTGDITGSIFSNTKILYEGKEPDVALSKDKKSKKYAITMTCKLDSQTLRAYRYNFVDFKRDSLVDAESLDTDSLYLGAPRIAANHHENAPTQKWPYEVVVVGHNDAGLYQVYGFHYYNGQITKDTLNDHTYVNKNDKTIDPRQHKTKEPVVSFLEDIKVAWAYNAPGLDDESYEIIKRTLSVFDGTPRKYNPNQYSYSIVNDTIYNFEGDQIHPCICSRFAYLKEQFIGWYDNKTRKPDFKHRHTNVEIYGAKAEISPDHLVYPNPADENLFITLDDKATKANIDIYSIDGRHMLSRTIQPQNNKVDISNLNSGIYLLKVKTGRKQKTAKVIVR